MSPPVIARVGLATPLGLGAAATTHALAAGLACFRDTEVQARDGEPVRAAWLRSLPSSCTRVERMVYFAARALRECVADLPRGAFQRVPVFLALPEVDRGGAGRTSRPGVLPLDILSGLRDIAPPGVALDWTAKSFAGGRAAFFQALDAAMGVLAARGAEAAIVLGVDSLCDNESLNALDDAERTLCGENPDGLIPGEGAGAILLVESVAARRAGLPALARVPACVLGRDTIPFEKRKAAHARGLTAVIRKLSRADPPRVDAVFSCQTAEGRWARELTIAHMRNPDFMPEPQKRYLLAENLGDAGAAGGAVQVAHMIHLSARRKPGRRKLDRAIVYGAADGGETGACVISVR